MRFDRIRLRNFKCYADADIDLRAGVTVIHGVNGSGKSSLLEACFFALYGARALEATLEDVVSNDADEMTVELWFTHAGGDYRLEREVRVRDDAAQTTTCLLETPTETIEQVTDVEAHVQQLLRMDAEAFVNCAYVRQGEVNKLINASPGDRQDMIDDLLQLGKLEDYRERASDARVGVGRVRDDKRGRLSQLEDQIAAKEDKDLHERLNALQSELAEVGAEIEDKEANREAAVETREEAERILAEHEERRAELETLEVEIESLTEEIADVERERETLGEELRECRDRLEEHREALAAAVAETELEDPDPDPDAVDERLAGLDEEAEAIRDEIEDHRLAAQEHAGEAETARERAEELTAEAAAAREEAAALEAEVESEREGLSDRREELADIEARIEELTARFDAADVDREAATAHREAVADELTDARERVAELRADLTNQREAVAEAEALLEAGKCPECGQPVEESPHVSTLEEDRELVAGLEDELDAAEAAVADLEADLETADELVETAGELDRLETLRETDQELIDQQSASLTEKTDRAAALREEAADADDAAEATREAAEAAEERAAAAREAIGELNGEKAAIDERRERLEAVADRLETIADLEDEGERLRERRENMAAQNDLRRERLAEKRDRRDELQAAVDAAELERAETEKERAEQYIEQVDAFLAEKRDRRDELQAAIGGVENELEALEELREDRDELAAAVDRLESLYEEAATLQETYAELRAELRQRNVAKLEAMLNETFELVYQNDSYSRIELDGDYELTVYQKDGEPLDPEQLSGGERALFNLSLRCAIYRLLSEGIEGAAPTPPLILDEPTVFLDSGHVAKLVELVETMYDHGVAQIIVVSHDDELVGAADDLVAVRKDATTNRSTVERTHAVAPS